MRPDRCEREEGGIVAEPLGVGEAVDDDDRLPLVAVMRDLDLPIHAGRCAIA